MKLLPAQEKWCTEAASALIDGSNLMVRGLPATGKSVLVEGIEQLLGPSALIVRGRAFTEQDRDEAVDAIQTTTLQLVERHGCAQLLFDDYPHALRRSYGAQLQRSLLHLLVDGPSARDIGALLTGRWATSMHLRVRGSPLVARAARWALPEAGDSDYRECVSNEQEIAAIQAAIGRNCVLLGHMRKIGGRVDLSAAQELADNVAQSLVDDLPLDAVAWLRSLGGTTPVQPLDGMGWEAVQPLVTHSSGSWALTGLVASSAFPSRLAGRSLAWPATWVESVAQFTNLIAGADALIWADRYLMRYPCKLLAFVEEIRRTTDAKLRLLFSSSVAIEEMRREVGCVRGLSNVPGCELRSMTPGFYRLLHDRQLAFLGDREDGVVLPTCDVVLGTAPVGTAMAVQVSLLDRELYQDAWAAAIPLSRLPLPSS